MEKVYFFMVLINAPILVLETIHSSMHKSQRSCKVSFKPAVNKYVVRFNSLYTKKNACIDVEQPDRTFQKFRPLPVDFFVLHKILRL